VPYPVRSALFQWEDGERRLRALEPAPVRHRLERQLELVVDELRRRLGSTFTLEELADYYGQGTGWADELVGLNGWLVDAAFGRYAREAKNYAGGKARALG
jgi:hypothetical protein